MAVLGEQYSIRWSYVNLFFRTLFPGEELFDLLSADLFSLKQKLYIHFRRNVK